MAHIHTYFSELHADKQSQFANEAHHTPDTKETVAAREKLIAQPNNYELLMDLAKQLCFQLRYREAIEIYDRVLSMHPNDTNALLARAVRYYNTLQFEEAHADYTFCLNQSPDTPYILYRLGITSYAMGKNAEAEICFDRCMTLYADEPEMRVASAYWLALTVARTKSGNSYWQNFDFSLEIGHHTGYRDGLAVWCGKADVETMYVRWMSDDDALNCFIVLYSIASYCQYNGLIERANTIYDTLFDLDEFWASFAYIAAWAEKRSATAMHYAP